MTTPREALCSLLAVPYWTLAVLLGGAVGSVVPGWWAAVAGLTIGTAARIARSTVLDWVADWVWVRVEVLARGWRELTRPGYAAPSVSEQASSGSATMQS